MATQDATTAAWSEFWREQGPRSRCLQGASGAITLALDRHWRDFAAALPPNERVLDIACGAGAVALLMISVRPDLRIAGIDRAEFSPATNLGFSILPGVSMEDMPFTARTFGTAVSLFGFEYGDTERASKELERVLSPGGTFSFLTHHAQSPIIEHNRHRRDALAGVLSNQMKEAFVSGNRVQLSSLLASLQQEFAGVDVTRHAAANLPLRLCLPQAQRSDMWTAFTEALQLEQILLRSLVEVHNSPSSISDWLKPLAHRFVSVQAQPLRTAAGEPIAWHVSGRANS